MYIIQISSRQINLYYHTVMSLPPEKLNELKQVIHNHLTQLNIHDVIRQCMSESLKQDETGPIEEEGLLNTLREKGIIEDVMHTLQFDGITEKRLDNSSRSRMKSKVKDSSAPLETTKVPLDPTKRYLYLQILGGKAFLEHLQDPEPIPGRPTSLFTLCVHFREQRFQSRPVPCACEPDIQEGFLLELQKNPKDGSKMSDAPSLLTLSSPIHLVLIKTDLSGNQTLLSSHYLEWRKILSSASGRFSLTLEMNGIGTESKVPVGVLEVKAEIVPKLPQIVTSDVITGQLNLEKNRIAERERLFLAYAKQWWREYLQIRASHSNRLVKIFAQDENATHKPVCSFVRPLRTGRLIDTPRQAARFVSLLGFEKAPVLGGTKGEMWMNLHSFLCQCKGEVEDHAVLLCSLLLGFGLNAYVCIGAKSKGIAHAWVVTIATDGIATFWESLTAQRYIHRPINPDDPPSVPQPKPQHPYRTIGCVFNHQEFYANSQPSDNVDVCIFDLHNESLWKCMSKDAIKSVCGSGITPSPLQGVPLIPSPIDPVLASNELENDLRTLIVEHRNDMGLTTTWDDELSYLLSPALAAYEMEHTAGISIGNEEFQQAIRRHIPDGQTFKGFPIQFIHRNSRRAFATCLKSPICEEIICCRGDQVRLAVRARVYTYPERTCAVWIMFAVKYRSIL